MGFITPPQNQGQIVDVSYAETPHGIIMRVFDRSDRTTYYKKTPWTKKLLAWSVSSGPQNEEPPTARWFKVSEAEVSAWSQEVHRTR